MKIKCILSELSNDWLIVELTNENLNISNDIFKLGERTNYCVTGLV